MAVRIMYNDENAVLYCSTTDWAFGPLFSGDDEHSAEERAQLFLDWLPQDAREYEDNELEKKYNEWLTKEKELWTVKENEMGENDV